LNFRAFILGFLSIAAVSGCERSTWPPNQAEMDRIFEQKKATFVELEQQMAADGLLRMSPGVFSEMERNPTILNLPSNQAEKYLTLFKQAQIFVSVVRHEEATEFEMMIESVGPRLYLSRFVHSALDRSLPKCAESMGQLACGVCGIDLERDWLVEHSWFPADPDEEARQC
jgi:hypothetical protein